MRLWWKNRKGDFEQSFEIEADSVGEIIVIYKAITKIQKESSEKNKKPSLKNKKKFTCNYNF